MPAKYKLLIWVAVILGLFAVFKPSLNKALAAITASSRIIPYQGRLTDSGGNNVADGSYAMTFKIYTVSTGGSASFTEAHSSVSVSSGLFSVLLGSLSGSGVNLDFANPPYYLGITIGNNSEMSPRIQLGFVPLAHNAQYLDGTPLSSFVLNTGNINTATGALQTNGVTRIDNSGVGTFAAGTTIGGASIPGGSGINSIQTFSTSGTWTKPSGVTKVLVEVQGGGGGGGGAAGDASYGRSGYYGGKGAAGGFCRKLIDVSAVSTVTVTIGGGGGGGNRGYGSNNDDTSGTAGGASSFGSYCTANGGGGGQRGQTAGASTGGTSTGGDINVTGQGGSPGYPAWYGAFLGQGMNNAGHGGNGGECCGNPYALGNNGYPGTAGNVVVWEYK